MPASDHISDVRYQPVPGYPKYRVGDDGSFWAWLKKTKRWKRLNGTEGRRGYCSVSLVRDGVPLKEYLHRLVLTCFAGPCPEGMECRHIDGNPRNNRLGNLQWGTHTENMQDMMRHGKWKPLKGPAIGSRVSRNRGEANGGAKLRPEDVLEIRRLRTAGVCRREIAARFHVHQMTVAKILTGKRWRHLAG